MSAVWPIGPQLEPLLEKVLNVEKNYIVTTERNLPLSDQNIIYLSEASRVFLKLIKFASLARLGWIFAHISELNHDDEVTLGHVFSIFKKMFFIYYEWVTSCDVIIVVCATDAL